MIDRVKWRGEKFRILRSSLDRKSRLSFQTFLPGGRGERRRLPIQEEKKGPTPSKEEEERNRGEFETLEGKRKREKGREYL